MLTITFAVVAMRRLKSCVCSAMGLAVEVNTFGTCSQITNFYVNEYAMGALCYVCRADDRALNVFYFCCRGCLMPTSKGHLRVQANGA